MLPNRQIDEKLIWQDFQSGDEKAYAYIFNTFFAFLYNYGLKISSDDNLVKDCIQELFIKLWRTRENLSQPTSIKKYLSESLRRTIIREITRNRYKMVFNLKEDYHFETVLSQELRIIDIQITEERLKYLELALKQLTKRQRDAIHLKFYGKLGYEQIAEIMDISINSVYNLISKALEILYKEINHSYKISINSIVVLLSAGQLAFTT